MTLLCYHALYVSKRWGTKEKIPKSSTVRWGWMPCGNITSSVSVKRICGNYGFRKVKLNMLNGLGTCTTHFSFWNAVHYTRNVILAWSLASWGERMKKQLKYIKNARCLHSTTTLITGGNIYSDWSAPVFQRVKYFSIERKLYTCWNSNREYQ